VCRFKGNLADVRDWRLRHYGEAQKETVTDRQTDIQTDIQTKIDRQTDR